MSEKAYFIHCNISFVNLLRFSGKLTDMKHFLTILFCLLIFWTSCPTFGMTHTPSKYDYESLYIYNFTKYIYWPNSNGKIVIGVIGNSAAVYSLKNLAGKKNGENVYFEVKYFPSVAQISDCNILFVTSEADDFLPTVKQRLTGKNTLLITEETTQEKISPVNLIWNREHTRLDFTIDKAQIEKIGLKVSAKLLQMAKN